MITRDNFRAYRGKSSDTKPNVWHTTYNADGTILAEANVGNGDTFYEIDTGKTYVADGDGETWEEQ